MRNEDNHDCIRYLMKEMDPSEELLMERAMMEDEDLLIEVESMRQTLKKLDQLPEVEPPFHVRESIRKKAAEQAKKNRQNNSTFKPVLKYAVAATLALTVSAGGAWLFIDTENNRSIQQTETSITSTAQSPDPATQLQVNKQVGTRGRQMEFTRFVGSNVPTASSSSRGDIDPWIDREDILHFEDQFSTQKEQFQDFIQRSREKLQLIESTSINDKRINSIQLTGTGN